MTTKKTEVIEIPVKTPPYIYLVWDRETDECGAYAGTKEFMDEAIKKYPSLVARVLDFYVKTEENEIFSMMRYYSVRRMLEFRAHKKWQRYKREVRNIYE